MPKPTEFKTVQNRILTYAQEIGWTYVPRQEAEIRRGFNKIDGTIEEKAQQTSLYFDNILYQKVKEFNPNYAETKQELIKQLTNLAPDIYGNRDLLNYLRNQGKYFYQQENRELDLILIDYSSLQPPLIPPNLVGSLKN